MKLPRRQFLHLAASAAALPAVSRMARAQTYPTRPVRIVVGYAPGGAGDISMRLMGQWLSERLGQQFIIENRTGAGTNIATEAVVRAAADGYTLLMSSAANAINATLAVLLDVLCYSCVVETQITAAHAGPVFLELLHLTRDFTSARPENPHRACPAAE